MQNAFVLIMDEKRASDTGMRKEMPCSIMPDRHTEQNELLIVPLPHDPAQSRQDDRAGPCQPAREIRPATFFCRPVPRILLMSDGVPGVWPYGPGTRGAADAGL